MSKIIQEDGRFFIQKELSSAEMQNILLEATGTVQGELNEVERFKAEISKYQQAIVQYETQIKTKLDVYGITEEFLGACSNYFPTECNRLKF